METEPKLSRSLATIALRGLGLGVFAVDGDFRVTLWNQWMELHSGVKAQDIVGSDLFERFPEIVASGKDGPLRNCVKLRRPRLMSPSIHHQFVPMTILKGETRIPMCQDVKIYPVDGDEEPHAAIVVVQDVTERCRYERSLTENARVLRGIIDELNQTKDELEKECAKSSSRARELEKALDGNQVLLRELYHRTKNNMCAIIGMIDLNETGDEPPVMANFLDNLKNRIHAMALVHDMLYRCDDLYEIDLSDYLRRLVESIVANSLRPETRLELEIESMPISVDAAIPFGLIVNELCCNSLKHAFAGEARPRLELRVRRLDGRGHVELIHSDNGVGLPDDFDWDDSEGMGMRIIRDMVAGQLKGRSEILPGVQGAAFRVSFRVPETQRRSPSS